MRTKTTPRVIAREYRSPSGEAARLEYHPRGGAHRVYGYRGCTAARWDCDSVEAARARWARLRADLVAAGFRESK